jgi:hypothetical protein
MLAKVCVAKMQTVSALLGEDEKSVEYAKVQKVQRGVALLPESREKIHRLVCRNFFQTTIRIIA